MTDSPLQNWLNERGLTQAQLALLASTNCADVNRVVKGMVRSCGRLRRYLEETCPDVQEKQDRYIEAKRRLLQRQVEAA